MINDDTAPHSLEPQFRKLGMPTSLVKGVPSLKGGEYRVCKKGEKLKADQAHILKLFGKPMATVGLHSGILCVLAAVLTITLGSHSPHIGNSSKSYLSSV